ncbi:MAG: DUF1569 domain-containing protein [Bacteroidota bacterium]
MPYPLLFDPAVTQEMLDRLEKIQPDTVPQWGKMNAPQMLAHLNVAYDITYGKVPIKYNAVMRFFLRKFVKAMVVGDKPYPRNGRTAPIFKVEDERDFAVEKEKLVTYIQRFQQDGAAAFEGQESPSFGKLTAQEWSNQFWKHMDHHLRQFGV